MTAEEFHLALAIALEEALPDRDQQVLSLRHGLSHTDPLTLRGVGRAIDRSGERVRQLTARAMRELRGRIRRDQRKSQDSAIRQLSEDLVSTVRPGTDGDSRRLAGLCTDRIPLLGMGHALPLIAALMNLDPRAAAVLIQTARHCGPRERREEPAKLRKSAGERLRALSPFIVWPASPACLSTTPSDAEQKERHTVSLEGYFQSSKMNRRVNYGSRMVRDVLLMMESASQIA